MKEGKQTPSATPPRETIIYSVVKFPQKRHCMMVVSLDIFSKQQRLYYILHALYSSSLHTTRYTTTIGGGAQSSILLLYGIYIIEI